MNTKIADIAGKVFQFGIGIIGSIITLMILKDADEGMISGAISLSLWSIYIAAGVAILFAIYHFVTNIKGNMKSLIGIVAFGLIIVISYVMAGGQPTSEALLEKADAGQILMSDTGLFMFYILISLTVLAIIVVEVSRLFK